MRGRGEALAEGGGQRVVDLERQEPARRAGQAPCERALAGPDLDDEVARGRLHEGHDALGHGVVAEEMLAERARLAGGGAPHGTRSDGPRVATRAHALSLLLRSARSAA